MTGAGAAPPPITSIVADMPWPASCRYCDLVTEDPDAFFRPIDIEADRYTECADSPSGFHECRDLHDYGLTDRAASSPAVDFPFDAADRLTAIIESRMSHDLAFLRDDGVTVERLNPEQVAYALMHLYRTGDVVSGLAALGESDR